MSNNVDRQENNSSSSELISPKQLLEMAIEEIDSGKLSPNRAIIILVSDVGDNAERISARWSNMGTGQSVYYLNKVLYTELHRGWK